jgi:hypothetical protein
MIKALVLLLFCNDPMLQSPVVQRSHLLHSRPIDQLTKMVWDGIDAAHHQMSAEEVEDLVAECLLAERMHRQSTWMVDGDPNPMVWLIQH